MLKPVVRFLFSVRGGSSIKCITARGFFGSLRHQLPYIQNISVLNHTE
jgi:hypothetical protein